jgi:hypothetical protein
LNHISHQSQLVPAANKFHAGNGGDGKHYWLTPPDLYARLNARFHFDFDPCPYPKPEGFDGLTCEWGRSNYVNPPFGSIMHQGPGDKKPRKKGPTAWIRKAILEASKGKFVALVYPIDKWLFLAVPEIENLYDVRWLATEDGSQGKGTGRHIALLKFGTPPTAPSQEAPNHQRPLA